MSCWIVSVPASFEPYWATPATFGPFKDKDEAKDFADRHPSREAFAHDETRCGQCIPGTPQRPH